MVAEKRGRPTINPKTKPIHVRLDEESANILNQYCNQENLPKTEGIRRGIKKLRDDIKKIETAPARPSTKDCFDTNHKS